jgi:hypothetical protein
VAMAASSLKKKLKKKIQKKTYTVFVYIKMYKKNIFFLKILSMFIWLLNLIKVTALPIYYFFFYFEKIKILFVINAGIEPAFSVKFGNRTRIYIVLRESNPDCTNLREGDGRI